MTPCLLFLLSWLVFSFLVHHNICPQSWGWDSGNSRSLHLLGQLLDDLALTQGLSQLLDFLLHFLCRLGFPCFFLGALGER